MKRIFRIIIFSTISLYITSVWNLGFIIPKEPLSLIYSALIIGIVFYLILPLSKLILLPLNILTLGLASLFLIFGILHILNIWGIVTIKSWNFYGISYYFLQLSKMHISYLMNLVLSALSISTIINLLELLV